MFLSLHKMNIEEGDANVHRETSLGIRCFNCMLRFVDHVYHSVGNVIEQRGGYMS